MVAIKRKAEAGAPPPKKRDAAPAPDRSAKRQRKSDAAKHSGPPSAKSPSAKSVFKDDDKAFPRGGASVLTPLEHKQIQIQATQDVLFEQAGLKRKGDNAPSDADSDVAADAPKADKKRKSKKTKQDHIRDRESRLKVEGLSYKKLVAGTIVLGQVVDITSRDLLLALPNHLYGTVPLTAISDKLNARIETLLQDTNSKDEHDLDEDEDVHLGDMFRIGQYLRACVTSSPDEALSSGTTTKKRIELSINPTMVNRGINKSSLAVNGTLQAAVVSNEDHGLVMEVGLEDADVKAFLPGEELPKDLEHSKVQEGAVFLCTMSRLKSGARIISLSAARASVDDLKNLRCLTQAPTIDAFLPGTAVDMLVTDTTPSTITGKLMGMLDATADIVHSGAALHDDDLRDKYKVGSKVKATIISTFPASDPKKVAVSLLDHVVALAPRRAGKAKDNKSPLDILAISSILEEAEVTRVEPLGGLYFSLGHKGTSGFAHISKITEGKIDRLSEDSGRYKLGSKHRARITGYNAMDSLFQLSLQEKVINQPFIRIQDIKIGQVVKGKVHKLIADKRGSTGVLVELSEGITGLVPELHLADARLQHPERKFREGNPVTARVLVVNVEKRHVTLTLKKSLVNSDAKPWVDYGTVSVGDRGPGTLVEVRENGALVRFYGDLKAWLPVAEMSEAYIQNATRHFQKGQVVNLRVLSVDPEAERLLVSCKDPEAVDPEKEAAFKSLNVGDVVRGNVLEKSPEAVVVDLGHGVKGTLRLGHLTDGSEKKDKATLARIRVGGPLDDVVIIDKHIKTRTVVLTNKPLLRKDAQANKLITDFDHVREGATVNGFVRGILPDKVFVEFAGGTVGVLFQSQLPDDLKQTPNFGLRIDQTITAHVNHVDTAHLRFWLSMRAEADSSKETRSSISGKAVENALDNRIKSTLDLSFGTEVTVRIKSVKSTQLNVQVADNVHGRITVAECFNDWNEIEDKKHPLSQFKTNEHLLAKVLGQHDAKNHRFLPISHRQGRSGIYELSTKKDDLGSETDILTLDKITPGSSHLAFINNIADRHVWVDISANIRGRIDMLNLSDDLSLLADLEKNFPIGSALKVRVKTVDVASKKLELTAVTDTSTKALQFKDMTPGLILPARVTKIHESSIVVQINENIAGPVFREQLADDYDNADPKEYKLGSIIRVCVTEVDVPNKKLGLSARPSRVLSSELPVKDPSIEQRSQLRVNQVVRGFVKWIADSGVTVRLGPTVEAFVRVSHLSDSFIKDWKSEFQVDQLVRGKIIANDSSTKHPQMSLKKSIVDGEYIEPLKFSDIKPGQIVTAKVRKVVEYGAFLVIDDSDNVSGLCHASEMADSKVKDPKALYKEGEAVKAKVLEVDARKRRVSFGLKYSYIKGDNDEEEDDVESDDQEDNASLASNMEVDDDDIDMRSIKSADEDAKADTEDDDSADDSKGGIAVPKATQVGLSTSGFDWTGATLNFVPDPAAAESSSDEDATAKKKKHKKAAIKEDRTGDLDTYGPQSVADYERLLLGRPNSAELWVRYMVFQRELNEVEKARQIARRALGTMNPREEKERLDVWTALLHLENDFGSDDVIEETFKEACQNNDSREVHERMIKIYISSGKLDKADNLYAAMTRVKSFTPTPTLWLSYATFLMTTLQPPSASRARALLSRATQSVPSSQHRYLTTKFGALEYKSPNGDAERGRTIFEGLVSTWPKKGDIWDMYVDLERAHGDENNVRDLFERMSRLSGMKRKRASLVFGKWKEWEEQVGNKEGLKKVEKAEREWAEKKNGGDEA